MESNNSSSARSVRDGVQRQSMDENMQKSIFAGGSALGAVAMSSCCILPLALFSLGVTGAWIGNLAALYPYKPYFFVATAAFLAVGFCKIYRKPAVDCAQGSYCASPVSDRVNKIVLWSATLLVLAALVFPYAAPLILEYWGENQMKRHIIGPFAALVMVGLSGPSLSAERTVDLAIKMDCPTCPYMVKRSLQKVSGVLAVNVSYDEQAATVRFDDAKTDTTALTNATKAVGFPSTVVR